MLSPHDPFPLQSSAELCPAGCRGIICRGHRPTPAPLGASPQLCTPAMLLPSWVQTRGCIYSLLTEYLANPKGCILIEDTPKLRLFL